MSAVLAATPALAQQVFQTSKPTFTIEGRGLDQPGLLNPQEKNYRSPIEPVFEKVTYLKIEPPGTLNERIDRLIHGIYVDVPPEYDHYGYEIRRYMSAIGNVDAINSNQNLQGQIKNIKSAEIILKYWAESLRKEFAEIEAEIETSNASSSTRSSFKYHRGVAEAFLTEATSWMRNNRKGLEYLLEIGAGSYQFDPPKFIFKDQKQLKKYTALYEAQQKALEQMKEYTPFRMMVY